MIAWTIERAVASNLFDKVMVSTDDFEIAEIAKKFGASVDDLRSAKLSDDSATLIEVMNFEAMNLIQNHVDPLDSLCCLYSASPFLEYDSVSKAINIVKENKADYAISVKEFEQPPMRAFTIEENGYIRYKFPQYSATRTQDLEKLYTDAAQFTIASVGTWAKNNVSLEGSIYPIVLGKYAAIDIDGIDDWKFAEEIFEIRLGKLD